MSLRQFTSVTWWIFPSLYSKRNIWWVSNKRYTSHSEHSQTVKKRSQYLGWVMLPQIPIIKLQMHNFALVNDDFLKLNTRNKDKSFFVILFLFHYSFSLQGLLPKVYNFAEWSLGKWCNCEKVFHEWETYDQARGIRYVKLTLNLQNNSYRIPPVIMPPQAVTVKSGIRDRNTRVAIRESSY